MKTIDFSNGTEYIMFAENNCWLCKKYNEDSFENNCPIETKLAIGCEELSNDELREYFGNTPVIYASKCLKIEPKDNA